MSTSKEQAESYIHKHKITMRTLRPGDQANIISLLDSPSIKSEIWAWQFESHHIDSGAHPVVAVDKWDNVLGYNGLMPFRLYAQKQEMNAAWSCDFFVSGEARGRGVGKGIKQALKEQSDICFALGTSATAAVVLQQSGWLPYLKVHSYQRKPEGSSEDWMPVEGALDSLPPAEAVDSLWDAVKADYGAMAVRNHAYLNWRYVQAPIAKYRYLHGYSDGQLSSIAVLFEAEDYVSLVDYVGHRPCLESKRTVLDCLLRTGKRIRCTTSCPTWEQVLSERDFTRSAIPVNCFIYAVDAELGHAIADDFFIMAGDCDGDILMSSVEAKKSQDALNLQGLRVDALGEADFRRYESRWNSLLESTPLDHPFLSWEWVFTWWKTFSRINRFRLRILCCWQGEKLVGIAPLYERHYLRFGIRVTQLQLIGCSWSGPNTFRSEYLDFIIHSDFQRSARVELLRHLFSRRDWDEFVLGDTPRESLTIRLLGESYSGRHVYIRTGHRDISIRLPVDLAKDEYMANLSGNLRRNAFNKFEQLVKATGCESRLYTHSSGIPFNLIDTLNRFHLPRWGKLCFESYGRRFHEAIIREFDRRNRLAVASIAVGEQPISVAYNILYKDSVYNIQLGFSNSPELRRYSLGLLQLGQCVLFAMENSEVKTFDLLAGFGKQDYYKSRFGGHHYHIETKQYLRSPWLILLYKLYDHRRLGLYKKLKKRLFDISKKVFRFRR